MITKLSKLEQKLGNIDLEDLQTLSVDSPDHVYLQLLGNFEKKYGDTYRISDWLGDVREKLVLVLLLKIESLSNHLDTTTNVTLLTYVCDTVRICLRDPLELARVQEEHVLAAIVRILRQQPSLTLSTAALRLLLNLLNRQPQRMQLFVGSKVYGVQCLAELIRYGHRDDAVADVADAKDADRPHESALCFAEHDKHDGQVKLVHHAVRIVFMVACESDRLLTTLRGFQSLTVSCAKRLFLCLSDHNAVPPVAADSKDSVDTSLASFPFTEVNSQLFSDLVKLLYALDNLSQVRSLPATSTRERSRSSVGRPDDVDNNVADAEQLCVRVHAQWRRFLSLAEAQVSAYGVADPVSGARSKGAVAAETEDEVHDERVRLRLLDADERAMNAASLDEVRLTMLSQYRATSHRAMVKSGEDSEPSSTRTLVRVLTAKDSPSRSERLDSAALDASDPGAAPDKSDGDESKCGDGGHELWSPLALVAIVVVTVLTLGPCHFQPPLLFSEQLGSAGSGSQRSNLPRVDSQGPSAMSGGHGQSYRQLYQLVAGRLSEVEEVALQLPLLLPESLVPALFVCQLPAQPLAQSDAKRAQNDEDGDERLAPDVLQARRLLAALCGARVPWLADSLCRILYRLLLKTRRSATASSTAAASAASATTSAALIPALLLLTKIAQFLLRLHRDGRGAVSLALRSEIDNLRFALKRRVFPTPFDPSQHAASPPAATPTLGRSFSAPAASAKGGDARPRDELAPWDCPADSLRSELVVRMTSIACEGQLARIAAELLFVLCEEDKDEFRVRTGFGNAIHLLQLKGLL